MSIMRHKMNEIEELIKAIGVKHDCYCTFTIRSNHKEGKEDYGNVGYETYISEDIEPKHIHHNTIREASERLTIFLNKDVDKRERIKERISCFEDKIESDQYSLDQLKYDLHILDESFKNDKKNRR